MFNDHSSSMEILPESHGLWWRLHIPSHPGFQIHSYTSNDVSRELLVLSSSVLNLGGKVTWPLQGKVPSSTTNLILNNTQRKPYFILQAKISVLQDWIADLTDQNRALVKVVCRLEKEALSRVDQINSAVSVREYEDVRKCIYFYRANVTILLLYIYINF